MSRRKSGPVTAPANSGRVQLSLDRLRLFGIPFRRENRGRCVTVLVQHSTLGARLINRITDSMPINQDDVADEDAEDENYGIVRWPTFLPCPPDRVV
jgi:hypothetical protein